MSRQHLNPEVLRKFMRMRTPIIFKTAVSPFGIKSSTKVEAGVQHGQTNFSFEPMETSTYASSGGTSEAREANTTVGDGGKKPNIIFGDWDWEGPLEMKKKIVEEDMVKTEEAVKEAKKDIKERQEILSGLKQNPIKGSTVKVKEIEKEIKDLQKTLADLETNLGYRRKHVGDLQQFQKEFKELVGEGGILEKRFGA